MTRLRGPHRSCRNPNCPGKKEGFKNPPDHPGKGGTYDPTVKSCWICGAPFDKEEYSQWQEEQKNKGGTADADAKKERGIKMNRTIRLIIVIAVAVVIVVAVIFLLRGCATNKNTPTPTITLAASPTPADLQIKTAAISSSLDGKTFSNQGEYLDTNLGKRMTFTNRKVVIPAKAWNDPLTKQELKLVETTWISMQVDIPCGMTGVVFAGGLKQGTDIYENGLLINLNPGRYEFDLRNGEIVLWYADQEDHKVKDFDRIIKQIRNGNFDIKSNLDFLGVTADLFPRVPDDLVKKNNVQIIPDLQPTTK